MTRRSANLATIGVGLAVLTACGTTGVAKSHIAPMIRVTLSPVPDTALGHDEALAECSVVNDGRITDDLTLLNCLGIAEDRGGVIRVHRLYPYQPLSPAEAASDRAIDAANAERRANPNPVPCNWEPASGLPDGTYPVPTEPLPYVPAGFYEPGLPACPNIPTYASASPNAP